MKNCNDVFHKNCLTEKEKFLHTNFFLQYYILVHISSSCQWKKFEFWKTKIASQTKAKMRKKGGWNKGCIIILISILILFFLNVIFLAPFWWKIYPSKYIYIHKKNDAVLRFKEIEFWEWKCQKNANLTLKISHACYESIDYL